MPAAKIQEACPITTFSESYRRPQSASASADAIPLTVDDVYHVFHLTTPPNTVHHPPRLQSDWSRLRSTDLLHWVRDDSPVIRPGKDDVSMLDADGAWTGSAVNGPDGNLHIFYTGYNLSKGGQQKILKASSQDRHGSSFVKKGEEIKICCTAEQRATFEDIDFRDPYVFYYEEESLYWMLVGTRLSSGPHWSRGCLALLKSKDLQSWSLDSKPFYAPNDMHCPECPELFTLGNGKWYLVYSRFAAPDSGTVYRIADSPYGPFRVPRDGSGGRLDGRRWYAAKSCSKVGDPTKRIFFGWIGDFNLADRRWLWGGDMALPREISANADGTLKVDLAIPLATKQLASVGMCSTRTSSLESTFSMSSLGSTSVQPLYTGKLVKNCHQCLQFSIGEVTAFSFGFLFQADTDLRGYKLRFKPSSDGKWEVTLLTDLPPLDDFWADQYDLYIPRSIDGPEVVRHEGLVLDSPVTILRTDDLLEIFLGGRSISFRLPPVGDSVVANDQSIPAIQPYVVFVEDGSICLRDIGLSVIAPM